MCAARENYDAVRMFQLTVLYGHIGSSLTGLTRTLDLENLRIFKRGSCAIALLEVIFLG